jgi:hypothetical protein
MSRRAGASLPGLAGRKPGPAMGALAVLLSLEDAARRAGLELKYGDLRDEEMTIRSGACQLRQRRLLLVDKRLGTMERARVIARELAHVDLEAIYLPPAARELIDSLGR